MSPTPDDITARYAMDLASAVERAVGRDRIVCVFLGGSVARGETAAARVGSDWVILSDVDLYVVVDDATDLESARRRARSAAAVHAPRGEGYRFLRRPDVGVYSAADLAAQPARPGTVGLADSARVLFGDRRALDDAARSIGSDIDRSEALYLLENRAREAVCRLLRPDDPGPVGRVGMCHAGQEERAADYPGDECLIDGFLASKTAIDTATAELVYAAAFDPGRRERRERFERMKIVPDSVSDGGRARERIAGAWRAVDALPDPAPMLALGSGDELAEAARMAADAWRRLARRHFNAGEKSLPWLLEHRCKSIGYKLRLREYAKTVRPNVSWSEALRLIVPGARFGVWIPLRLSGVVLATHESGEVGEAGGVAIRSYLDRMTRAFGRVEGDPHERALKLLADLE